MCEKRKLSEQEKTDKPMDEGTVKDDYIRVLSEENFSLRNSCRKLKAILKERVVSEDVEVMDQEIANLNMEKEALQTKYDQLYTDYMAAMHLLKKAINVQE